MKNALLPCLLSAALIGQGLPLRAAVSRAPAGTERLSVPADVARSWTSSARYFLHVQNPDIAALGSMIPALERLDLGAPATQAELSELKKVARRAAAERGLIDSPGEALQSIPARSDGDLLARSRKYALLVALQGFFDESEQARIRKAAATLQTRLIKDGQASSLIEDADDIARALRAESRTPAALPEAAASTRQRRIPASSRLLLRPSSAPKAEDFSAWAKNAISNPVPRNIARPAGSGAYLAAAIAVLVGLLAILAFSGLPFDSELFNRLQNQDRQDRAIRDALDNR